MQQADPADCFSSLSLSSVQNSAADLDDWTVSKLQSRHSRHDHHSQYHYPRLPSQPPSSPGPGPANKENINISQPTLLLCSDLHWTESAGPEIFFIKLKVINITAGYYWSSGSKETFARLEQTNRINSR